MLKQVLVAVVFGLALAGQSTAAPTVRQMLDDDRYWPPACNSAVCVLTGLGGIVWVWTSHVDEQLAKGRSFVVKGVCASACEIAARRAGARVLPGAVLIPHKITATVWE